MATLDANDCTDNQSSSILTAVQEGLVKIGNDGGGDKLVPAGAESWETSEDGLTWTFHLRKTKWSEGEPVVAQNYVDSFMRILNPDNGFGYAFLAYDLVGLNREHANRFVYESSGGQRQRIGIARALAVEAKFILCDEPISALDVSIQAQVANLLIKLQKELGLTYLFIAHDLSMVKHISDRVAVMYLGSMAELAESEELYNNPKHPYTKALMSAIPIADPDVEESRERIMLTGDVPSPINTPIGCKFQGRCDKCIDICRKEVPEFKEIEKNHFVACHLY